MKNPKPKLLEKDFQKQIVDLAHLYGWRVAHFRKAWSADGKRCMTAVAADGAGWPDLTLVKGEVLIFAEIKSDKGQASPEQIEWLHMLKKTGNIAKIWRPSDWDEIQNILTQ
jgi:hypothetical protein